MAVGSLRLLFVLMLLTIMIMMIVIVTLGRRRLLVCELNFFRITTNVMLLLALVFLFVASSLSLAARPYSRRANDLTEINLFSLLQRALVPVTLHANELRGRRLMARLISILGGNFGWTCVVSGINLIGRRRVLLACLCTRAPLGWFAPPCDCLRVYG